MIRWRAAALTALVLVPATAGAQSAPKEPLKRTALPTIARPACSVAATPVAAAEPQRRRARDLARRAQEAAILGDRTSARDELRQAAALDPTNADLAYQLARAYEATGAGDDAVREYCRFLALASDAPEAAEARDRLASLRSAPADAGGVRPAAESFRRGLVAYDAGRFGEAETAFGRAIAAEPAWADAYYDRALTLLARGDGDRARRDLEQYLRLKPEAEDRTAVVARIDDLRRRSDAPAQALALGLIIPGGGQFYTGRAGLGLAALAGAGAAAAYGFQQRVVTRTVDQQATDPFGHPYTYTVTQQSTERPNVVPGVAAVAAILVGGAIEAYLHARDANGTAPRVSVAGGPGYGTLSVALSLP
jgi:tetratricopeptide (TPR) repeat protein